MSWWFTTLAQFFEQLGAEHDIAVFAALSSADMNHHALAVDIADLQVCDLSTPQAGMHLNTRRGSSSMIVQYEIDGGSPIPKRWSLILY